MRGWETIFRDMCLRGWGTAYDEKTLQLYVQMHQLFKIWFIPGHSASASLVTVLQLVRRNGLYYIQSQHDLYQVNEFVKFFRYIIPLTTGVLEG